MTNPDKEAIAILSRKDVQEKLKWKPRVGDQCYHPDFGIGIYQRLKWGTYFVFDECNLNPQSLVGEMTIWLPSAFPSPGEPVERTLWGMLINTDMNSLDLEYRYTFHDWRLSINVRGKILQFTADTSYLAMLKTWLKQEGIEE